MATSRIVYDTSFRVVTGEKPAQIELWRGESCILVHHIAPWYWGYVSLPIEFGIVDTGDLRWVVKEWK